MAVSKNILQQKKEKQYLILDLNFVPYTLLFFTFEE